MKKIVIKWFVVKPVKSVRGGHFRKARTTTWGIKGKIKLSGILLLSTVWIIYFVRDICINGVLTNQTMDNAYVSPIKSPFLPFKSKIVFLVVKCQISLSSNMYLWS